MMGGKEERRGSVRLRPVWTRPTARAGALGALLIGLGLLPASAGAAELVGADAELFADTSQAAEDSVVGVFDDFFSDTAASSYSSSLSSGDAFAPLATTLDKGESDLVGIQTESSSGAAASGAVGEFGSNETGEAKATVIQTIDLESPGAAPMLLTGSLSTGVSESGEGQFIEECGFARVRISGAGVVAGPKVFEVLVNEAECDASPTPDQLSLNTEVPLQAGPVSIETRTNVHVRAAAFDARTFASANMTAAFDLDFLLCSVSADGPGQTTEGTSGDDVICGTSGPDTLIGKGGNDTILGFGGPDFAFGDDPTGPPTADAGDDKIRGGGGADELFGGLGNDEIDGGGGGDPTIRGGRGNDEILGGLGSDGVTADEPNATNGFIAGGGGNDEISGGPDRDFIAGLCADETICVHSEEFLGGLNDVDTISGGDGPDLILGDDDQDFIDGGGQGDQILGGTGGDHIFGGPGSEIAPGGGKGIEGGDGSDRINGGGGDDVIAGGEELDSLIGGDGSGRDKLRGGEESDCLDGLGGRDVFAGGGGDDGLRSRDGIREDVHGNGGAADKAIADRRDDVDGVEDRSPGPFACAQPLAPVGGP